MLECPSTAVTTTVVLDLERIYGAYCNQQREKNLVLFHRCVNAVLSFRLERGLCALPVQQTRTRCT